VDEFSLPVDGSGKYDLDKAPVNVWSYAPSGFYATNLGNAQRMANGNTLICHGPHGTFFEVDSDKDIVWEYISPVKSNGIAKQGDRMGGGGGMMGSQSNQCFRAMRYALDYAAFDDKDITPADAPLEGGELPTVESGKTTTVLTSTGVHVPGEFSLSSYTNPSNPKLATAINFTIPQHSDVTVKIYNAGGREVATLVNRYLSAGSYSYTWSANGCAGGVYFVRLVTKNYVTANRMVLLQ
jgi:hypothetical protein